MSPTLPRHANLDWLKNRARERLAELRRQDPDARLAQAQLDVARDYGFPSWRRLKAAVDLLSDHSDTELREEVVAAFLRAAALGEIERVDALLAAIPALVNAVGPHPFWGGRPQALHVVIEADRGEVFDRLLEAGADVDGRNDGYSHWSPLLAAIHRERDAMRDELLRRGAHIGLAEALALADDERLEAILAEAPAALVAPVPNGGSWLAFARTRHAVDRLLELGASADQPDAFGTTPIQALSGQGERGKKLIERLNAAGAAPSAAEHARLGNRDRLEALLAEDPEAVRDPSVVVAAVEAGHLELVAWLLTYGADPCARARGRARQTLLHIAAWGGDLQMARLLVEKGADLQARDAQYDAVPVGWAETAIEVANRPRCREVADWLRSL